MPPTCRAANRGPIDFLIQQRLPPRWKLRGQPAPEGPSDVSTFRPSAAPGGDPTGGGPLDLSFLTGESGNIEFAPLPVPILPAKDTP